MNSYIQPNMIEPFAEHRLMRVLNTERLSYYVMSDPGTGHFLIKIVFVDGQIVITGDLLFGGGNDRGVISDRGYGLGWFSGSLSERYLCEKFLAEVWQWEAAKETLDEWLLNPQDYGIPPEHLEKIRVISQGCSLLDGELTEHDFHEQLYELGQNYIDDGTPGYDYPRADAGWLCALQQKFAYLVCEQGWVTPQSAKSFATRVSITGLICRLWNRVWQRNS